MVQPPVCRRCLEACAKLRFVLCLSAGLSGGISYQASEDQLVLFGFEKIHLLLKGYYKYFDVKEIVL